MAPRYLGRAVRVTAERSGLRLLAYVQAIRASSAWVRHAYRWLPESIREKVARRLAERAALAARMPDLPPVRIDAGVQPARQEFPDRPNSGGQSSASGANLFGYFRGQFGLAEAARLYASALLVSGNPVALVDIDLDLPHGFGDESLASLLQDQAPHATSIVFVNPDYFEQAIERIGRARMQGRYIIACWFWELERIPQQWLAAFELVDEVLVASGFIEEAVRSATTKPVTRIPLPLFERRDSGLQRSDIGLADDQFVFMTSFDFHSWIERKNPLATMEAFRRAFGGTDAKVKLVVKTSNGHLHPQALTQLLAMTHHEPRIVIMDGIIEHAHLRAMQRCCDAYVSLHRAEGFGLGLAECMSMGKPVIATAWSGNLEFMTEDNSCLVPAELTAIPHGQYLHADGQRWAAPDVEVAANFMRRLVFEEGFAQGLGERGRASITRQLSPKEIGKMLAERLEAIALLRAASMSAQDKLVPATAEVRQ